MKRQKSKIFRRNCNLSIFALPDDLGAKALYEASWASW